MNLNQIIARVRRLINYVYDDTQHMIDLINEGQTLLAADAKIQGSYEIQLQQDQSSYPLPKDFKEFISLFHGNISSPDHIYELSDIDSEECGVFIYNNELVFRPSPGSNEKVQLHYYKYPNELVEQDDEPEIDSRYHEVLATYAAAMILSLPGIQVNSGLVDRYFAIWNERQANFKIEMQRKHKRNTVRKTENWW